MLHIASSGSSSLIEMTLKLTNKIDRKRLRPGDRIYAYRKAAIYAHHGIFIGGDRVIHFNRTQEGNTSRRGSPCRNCGLVKNDLRGVVMSCIDCFRDGHSLRRFRYGVSWGLYVISRPGTCTTGEAPRAEETISRAIEELNKKDFGDYHVLQNNCETFAVFCTTGNRRSDLASTAISAIKVAIHRLYSDVKSNHGKEKLNELKQAIENLFGDVKNPHGEEKLNKLNQMIDIWVTNRASPEEISDGLKNLEKDQ